jgi:hypothetical protein
MLVNIVGCSLFVSVAPAASFSRLCVVSLPAWILLVWFLSLPEKPAQVLTWFAWIFALVMAIGEPIKVQRHARAYLDLPSGRTAITEPGLYEEYRWLSKYARPQESFFEPVWAGTYVALGLHNPTPVPFVTSTDYTRPEQVEAVVQALEGQRVHLILWAPVLDVPLSQSGAGDHLGPLRAYVRAHYHVIKTFAGGDQVWKRNE